ncbi:DUF5131 family protein [Neisseria sp. 83E34]|uniref:DUF5131 family protein n=1 Tax=Neisseria sp. 83E34 TaxID=1692264 RepID=UPI000ACDAA65|nr:DUF5131 family protein [Neisseria sp. 83E34]
MANSNIEWTERTWNPITGCTKISPGCKNCYAESMAKRLQSMNTPGYENGFALTLMEGRLKEPAGRKKPTVYFVNSMSDTFHEDVPFTYIDRIFETIRQTPQHTYQVLTKRAERMAEYFAMRTVPENVWLGVSVEDRRYGLPRIELLRSIPATVRFISCEPLLENLVDEENFLIYISYIFERRLKMAQFIMNVPDAEKEAFMEAARLSDRNASQLVREFMRDFIEKQRYEAYVRAEVEKGLADIAAGRVLEHSEVCKKMEEKFARWAAEKASE